MTVFIDDARRFDIEIPVLVIGAGGCGLVAALAARDAGANVMVLERDRDPAGSTALSSGFIPAAFTRFQQAAGVVDSPEAMAADIQRKNGNGADPVVVNAACSASGPAIEWLADAHHVPFVLVTGFTYPGHSALRMHAVPERTGLALMSALRSSCEAAGIDIVTSAWVVDLIARTDRRVVGVRIKRPDGQCEELGCKTLVLACSGFGGNTQMVHEYLPEIADAVYFGHVGNQGDAIRWGRELGAATCDLTAYQGHGSVATPHGFLITWALMIEGGIQVNALGERFTDEHVGYSEQCLPVLRQPGGIAWNVYDDRMHRLGLEFDDYRKADSLGAIKGAPSVDALALACDLPREKLARTIAEVHDSIAARAADRFGRNFVGQSAWTAPLHAVKVTGALFHTQGGLEIDGNARVIGPNRQPLPNLFAGGGAARGLSGSAVWGYLSGNGLLSALVLGRLAGASAAAVAARLSADSNCVTAG